MMDDQCPIIDTHIHLYPSSEASTLAWYDPTGPLQGQHSVDEYEGAMIVGDRARPWFRGFVFIETDRKNTPSESDPTGWKYPLEEVLWIVRIARGVPREGEGHSAEQSKLCLAIVPWAPLANGVEALEAYVKKVIEIAGDVAGKIVGWRHLLQDKPAGTMLTKDFVDGLQWLGRTGYSFEVGIDVRSGGMWQLEEAVEMVRRAHEGVKEEEQVVFVFNHMCKPDLQGTQSQGFNGREYKQERKSSILKEWSDRIFQLASCPRTYMKVSGGFSEIEALPPAKEQLEMELSSRAMMLKEVSGRIEPWLDTILKSFGPRRIMFGSDWPVCNVGGGGNSIAWKNWWFVAQKLARLRLSEEDQKYFWADTAARVYKIHLPDS